MKAFDAQGKQSSLLYLTLGPHPDERRRPGARPRQPGEGAGAGARTTRASTPRSATLYRRRGQDSQAWQNYDFALRYEKDHPESLLGKSLLMLEQDEPEPTRWPRQMLKKLLEADPPPSPAPARHRAPGALAAGLARRRGLPTLKADEQKKLAAATGVPTDKAKASAEMLQGRGGRASRSTGRTRSCFLIKGRRLLLEGQLDAADRRDPQGHQDGSARRAQFYVELAKALMEKPGGEKEAAERAHHRAQDDGRQPQAAADARRRLPQAGQAGRGARRSTSAR